MKRKVKTNSAGFRQRHSFGSMNDRVRDVQCGKKKASWFNLSPSSGSHLLVYLPSLPSVKTLRMYPHKTQEKKTVKKKKITALQWAGCSEKTQRPQPMFSQQTAPHSCSPSLSIHRPQHPTWQKEREAQTNSERKSLLAANPSLAGFSRTAVSNKESCLWKKKERKKKPRVLHDNSARKREAAEDKGDEWWRDFVEKLKWQGPISPNQEEKVQWVHWLVDTQV